MGKIKFKNKQLKFKLTPSRIENNVILGETKFTIYGNLDEEKITILRKDFSYDMKMFRSFLQKMEEIKASEDAEAVFQEREEGLVIKIKKAQEEGMLNWDVEVKKSLSETNYTKLNIAFSTAQHSLDSIIRDIGYFVVNPTGF